LEDLNFTQTFIEWGVVIANFYNSGMKNRIMKNRIRYIIFSGIFFLVVSSCVACEKNIPEIKTGCKRGKRNHINSQQLFF